MSIISTPPPIHHSPKSPSVRLLATIPEPPAPLMDFDTGTRLDGVVIKAHGGGRFDVDTKLGQLTLHTEAPLAKDNRLALHIIQIGKTIQLAISEIDGNKTEKKQSNPVTKHTSGIDDRETNQTPPIRTPEYIQKTITNPTKFHY